MSFRSKPHEIVILRDSEESHMAQGELDVRVGTDILVRPLKFQLTSRALGVRPYKSAKICHSERSEESHTAQSKFDI